jgi:YD repeat-containing protein
MTSTMPKMLLALLMLATVTGAASARQTFYDSFGRIVGRSATDSQRTTTFYDASGRVIAKESKSGNTTTVYDERARVLGRRQ